MHREESEQDEIEREKNKNAERDELSAAVIGAAIEVHRHLGPGLLESVYQKCLCHEMELRGLRVQRQVMVPIVYKGLYIENSLFLDILVAGELILELKAVERMDLVFEAQLLTYLRLSGLHRGLLVNFNVPLLKNGIKRLVL